MAFAADFGVCFGAAAEGLAVEVAAEGFAADVVAGSVGVGEDTAVSRTFCGLVTCCWPAGRRSGHVG